MKIEASTTTLLLIVALVMAILVMLDKPKAGQKKARLHLPPNGVYHKTKGDLDEEIREEMRKEGRYANRR